MNKLIEKVNTIQKIECEKVLLIVERDKLQGNMSQIKSKLDNVKEKINFKDDELNKQYAELKMIMVDAV